jgi:acyl carrier protein
MSSATPDTLRETVMAALLDVAPDVDAEALDASQPFRDQFDFDSMDQLNFVVGLHERLGVDVPETDYPRLATLDGCVSYRTAYRGGAGHRPRR